MQSRVWLGVTIFGNENSTRATLEITDREVKTDRAGWPEVRPNVHNRIKDRNTGILNLSYFIGYYKKYLELNQN